MSEKIMSMSPSANNTATAANDSLDLAALMAAQKTRPTVKESATPDIVKEASSPLDDMLKRQQENGYGMVVEDTKLETEEKAPEFKNPLESNERMEAFSNAVDEQDQKLLKRQAVVQVMTANNQAMMAELEDELEALKFDDTGKPYFDYYDTDILGNKKQLTPKYFVIRTPEYGPYNAVSESYYVKGLKPAEVMKKPDVIEALNGKVPTAALTGNGPADVDGTTESSTEEPVETEESRAETEAHRNLVQLVIDKSGYGYMPIEFTESEKKSIYEADEILVTSVRKLDLKSIKVNEKNPDKPKRSFLETARAHQLSDSHANVTFPNSGFHAQMRGMSYGDLTDITVDPDTITFDKAYKQVTVVYNNMMNVSRPEFKSFDDFIKNFAYADLEMAIYGLYVATFPELQQLTLSCGKKECKTSFQHTYNTRMLLGFDRCSDPWLENFRKIINSPSSEYSRILDECPLYNTRLLELPKSKYIFEFGPITLYDYLYKVMSLTDENAVKQVFGENPSEHIMLDMASIPSIRRIFVPDGNGGYDEYDELKDMLDAMGTLFPEETKIVRSIAASIINNTTVLFGLSNVVCPKCGTKTAFIPIDISSLVFQNREQLENTNVDVKKWLQI